MSDGGAKSGGLIDNYRKHKSEIKEMEEQRNQLATRRSLCCGPKSLPNLLARHPLPLALTDIGVGQICSPEAGRQRRQRERFFSWSRFIQNVALEPGEDQEHPSVILSPSVTASKVTVLRVKGFSGLN